MRQSLTLEGMHPTLRQVPPSVPRFSMHVVLSPICAALMAATYPPGPPPITTTSFSSAAAAAANPRQNTAARLTASGRKTSPALRLAKLTIAAIAAAAFSSPLFLPLLLAQADVVGGSAEESVELHRLAVGDEQSQRSHLLRHVARGGGWPLPIPCTDATSNPLGHGRLLPSSRCMALPGSRSTCFRWSSGCGDEVKGQEKGL
ncbi:hypothetical protein B296_00007736 [Ensete ventricosum]|uniref:Uncharacterized protein n=1 Tax=Ensete ventricosum TaxID=4639 RepID=A0A427AXE5_ENSVE|nr:hypothetical protein B296_00007736 [Ensete ventricosum]